MKISLFFVLVFSVCSASVKAEEFPVDVQANFVQSCSQGSDSEISKSKHRFCMCMLSKLQKSMLYEDMAIMETAMALKQPINPQTIKIITSARLACSS